MKNLSAIVACCASAGFFLLAFPAKIHAQSKDGTVPAGYITYSLPATSTAVSVSYIGLPLGSAPVFRGAVASATANTISVAGTPWTPAAFSAAASPCMARFCSGQQAGRMILVTANSANSLTLDTTDHSAQTVALNTIDFAVQAGDSFEIVPCLTLAAAFGDGSAQNPVFLTGGTSVFVSDTIGIYNTIFGIWDAYYFDTAKGYWAKSGSTANFNNLVLYPEASLSITRRAGRPALSFVLEGNVPSVAPLTKTPGNAVLINTSTRYPVDLPLSSVVFNGWQKGSSGFVADTVAIWNPQLASFDSYYQRATDSQWRSLKSNTALDQSSLVIPAGQGFGLLKRAVVQNGSSYLSSPLPYAVQP